MRHIILKTEVSSDATLVVSGVTSAQQTSQGFNLNWVKLSEAKTNCADPSQCDLLSFEDESEAETILEKSDLDNDETVTIIGVDV